MRIGALSRGVSGHHDPEQGRVDAGRVFGDRVDARSKVVELKLGPHDEVTDSAGYEYLRRASERAYPRSNVDRHAANVVCHPLDLACVHARTNLDAKWLHCGN